MASIPNDLDNTRLLAEIAKLNAETERLHAETARIHAETRRPDGKLAAEAEKLRAESAKTWKESFWYPAAAFAGIFTAAAALLGGTVALVKILR